MPDRYADAVRARRHELRALRALLVPARTDLRDALAAARTGALTEAAARFAEVRRDLDGHPPAAVSAAARAIEAAAHAGWADRAVAAERGTGADRGVALPVPPDDPPPPAAPDPPVPRRARVVEVLADAGAWRLAVLPLAALSGVAGPAVLLPALGGAVLVLVAVVRSRRAAVDRARARRWGTDLLAVTHARIDAELTRRTAARASAATARLEAALDRRRAEIDAELALLAPREPAGA
ncbi:hypothetical protein GCM10017691_58080 [Pseudonocardia petroleophila]|uniref:Uncharacterized protein n=1 Tax=Pseudonocardia petroleophila TaxID=37331 RepID=A0A7G7MN01_9PSEU|nr:hypothetical protein [Pseudonocardia petroleophila]QNG54162.1 hypothetical protein H6H00_09810 [Pseudonocardia petroleophila]